MIDIEDFYCGKYVFLKERFNSKKVGSIKAGLHTKALKWPCHAKGKETALCCMPVGCALHTLRLRSGWSDCSSCRAKTRHWNWWAVPTLQQSYYIHKHAVALKALNPRDLKHKDIICCQLFWSWSKRKKAPVSWRRGTIKTGAWAIVHTQYTIPPPSMED